jgi:hypothetical protein
VTWQRLLHLATALLAAAISLGIRLGGLGKTGTSAAGTEAAAFAAGNSIRTVREPEFHGIAGQRAPLAALRPAPSSPPAHGSTGNTRTSLAPELSRSSSSGSEQIPLLVGAAEALRSALQQRVDRSQAARFRRTSLNQYLSLGGVVA